MRTTTDKYELPIAVASTADELAKMLGTSKGTVFSSISHKIAGWHKIIITDEDEQNE